MYNLTHNNHFKFGYNHEWFRPRKSADDQWMVSYGAKERPELIFNAECAATAALIRDTVSGPITVLFSGGSDSEIVVRSFRDQGIPINIAIMQFPDNLNVHDVSYAVVCCEQLGLNYDLVPLDIRKFLNEQVFDYAEATRVRSPELCATMWLADQVDGVPVIGSGECHVVKRISPTSREYPPTPWDLREKELIAGWYRHFMLPGKERMAVPGFFQYTPEIMLSFLKDFQIIELVADRYPDQKSTINTKHMLYRRQFGLAERKKYSGFEKLDEEVLELRREFVRRWPHAGGIFLTEYNNLLAMLEGEIEGPRGILMPNLFK